MGGPTEHPLAEEIAGAPLTGIRVIDFGQLIAVPCAAMILAELGADVIKIERLDGDPGRGLRSAGAGDVSGLFSAFNRSKRSVALDLKSPAGLEAVGRLIATADVVLQGFRPGVMDGLGLGPKAMLASHPRLIYGTVSAFGAGIDADRGGVDLIVQAESGMMSLTGEPDGSPTRVGFALVDVAAGNILAQAVLAALLGRVTTNRGMTVDVALIDVALHLQTGTFTEYLLTGLMSGRSGNQVPYGSPAGVWETADGLIAISGYQEAHWLALCQSVGRSDLPVDPRFDTGYGRIVNGPELWDELGSALRTATTDHWIERLRAAGVPAGRVRNHAEVAADPDLRARGSLYATEDEAMALRAPFRLSGGTFARQPGPVPGLGQHTEEILTELARLADGDASAAMNSASHRD